MLEVFFTSRCKKDLKKLKSSNRNEDEFLAVVNDLAHQRPLAPKHRDHALTGNYVNCRECHVRPDWLLIYKVTDTQLILMRTGSHNEFRRFTRSRLPPTS